MAVAPANLIFSVVVIYPITLSDFNDPEAEMLTGMFSGILNCVLDVMLASPDPMTPPILTEVDRKSTFHEPFSHVFSVKEVVIHGNPVRIQFR